MTYQWNPLKARQNAQKHGIRFADAVFVFEDDLAITIPDDYPDEDRYVTMGRDDLVQRCINFFRILVYLGRR